ncbi:MAG: sigma-E factor negative regulatory protein [Burkholderiaceae bacterium]|nr:sigma-E factor negative regulatory protein [Burkholderiaceae bacterium]
MNITGSPTAAASEATAVTNRFEQLSALADGQLQGEEMESALAFAADDEEGQAAWQAYHLVGDVLRSQDLARPVNTAFLSRLREQIAQEVGPSRLQVYAETQVIAQAPQEAANAAVFRWKMAAGFVTMAAVAAIGWTALGGLQGAGSAAGAQLAAAPVSQQAAPTVAIADAKGPQVMIRDPRLDELLAAHKQFGSTSALQMPAGFLRNATFETPAR